MPRRAMAWGLGLVAGTVMLSTSLLQWLGSHPQPGLDAATATALLGLRSMPPLPIFLLNAAGCALFVIGASVLAERRWRDAGVIKGLAATGRMAFTWYMAHIIIGLGGVILLGWTRTSHAQALLTAIGFFAIAVAVSVRWRQRFAAGPLEYVLRRIGRGAG